MNSRSGTSFPYGPNVMSTGNRPSEFGRYTFARRIAPSRMGTSAFCSTSILCRPVMAQSLPFRILRPPLWLVTAFINQFFQNIEAVARRIGIVPPAWDFHIELHQNLLANGRSPRPQRCSVRACAGDAPWSRSIGHGLCAWFFLGPRAMLRQHRERPHCLAAEQRDESEHPGDLGVDDQLDFDRSVR